MHHHMRSFASKAVGSARMLLAGALALVVCLGPFHAAHAHEFAADDQTVYSRFGPTRAFVRDQSALEAEQARIPGADAQAVELGRDLDGDGDADEIHIRLEVAEIQEEVYPGEFVTFWVF